MGRKEKEEEEEEGRLSHGRNDDAKWGWGGGLLFKKDCNIG